MTDVPFEDREDERELETDLLADPNAAGDPEPEDGRDGQPVRGGSDDPQHWAGEGRAPDSLRNAESAAMHIEEDGPGPHACGRGRRRNPVTAPQPRSGTRPVRRRVSASSCPRSG